MNNGCTSGYCHGAAAGGLALTDAKASYASLVDAPATMASCGQSVRVVPGDPDASVLWLRVRPAALDQGMPCGAKMPQGSMGLGDADAAVIEAQKANELLTAQRNFEIAQAAAVVGFLSLDEWGLVLVLALWLLAAAIECNMTRVFSLMLTSPATTHVFSNLGIPNDFHATVHAGTWDQARAGIFYQMQAFGAFLSKFAAVVEPNGTTLLVRSVIFGLSEYGEGYQHSVSEMPVVLAGGGNGRIRRNVHVREAGGNISKAHVTMLRGVGLDTPSFGWNGGETSEAFSDILV